MKSTFKQRITDLIESKGLSKSAFSKSIDKGASGLSGVLSRGSTPGADVIAKIIEVYPNVNPYWLLLGEGEMYLQKNENASNSDIDKIKAELKNLEKWKGQVDSNYEQLFQWVKELEKNKADRV